MVNKNVTIKVENVDKAARLYVYLREQTKCLRGSRSEEYIENLIKATPIMCLVELYDGLAMEEITVLTGLDRWTVLHTLADFRQWKYVTFDEHLLPGREWITPDLTKGMYKTCPIGLSSAYKKKRCISPTMKRLFITMLCNMATHRQIMKDQFPKKVDMYILNLYMHALDAIFTLTNLDIVYLTKNDKTWLQLENMGYLKVNPRLLNRRAYMLDNISVKVSV